MGRLEQPKSSTPPTPLEAQMQPGFDAGTIVFTFSPQISCNPAECNPSGPHDWNDPAPHRLYFQVGLSDQKNPLSGLTINALTSEWTHAAKGP
jgi:hypothetical protein